jgi:type III restriction enzyme
MQLTKHQQEAVDKLISKSRILLAKDGPRVCVFKAPTGAGKTIMVADFLRELSALQLSGRYSFLWIASNDLHEQSKKKVAGYLADSRYSFSLLSEVADDHFEENEIVFVNWESLARQNKQGDFTNVLMRENEQGRNLPTFVSNTKKNGVGIILIVDESHYRYWSPRSQELVQSVIAPKLTFEVSATPAIIPSPEEIEHDDAGFVSLKFEDVVEDGLIKLDTIVNESFGKYADFKGTADEAVIQAAIAKREALTKTFKGEKADVNPLLLIQLPSEARDTSALDKSKLEETIGILSKKHGITIENGKLAIWLADRKDNLDGIGSNDSNVEVLIFKQAIALGWDCPRAHILVMFRDIQVPTFEIQTVGRIMRMPEVKHYEADPLNHAYVFTNLDRVTIGTEGNARGYFRMHRATRKPKYKEIGLPSTYLSRIDYGDLTLSFRKLFVDEANKKFDINSKDSQAQAKTKADKDLDLLPDELKKPVIVDAVIAHLDVHKKREILGADKVEFKVSPDEIKRAYEIFAKVASLPFAPVRSHTKIQQAIYDWFDKQLGYEKVSRIEIQRIVVCSETNQKIFREIIEAAKLRFKDFDRKEKLAKQRRRDYKWDVPEVDYFNELYEAVPAKKTALASAIEPTKILLLKDRSQPERTFEELIDKSSKVEWWYKNGVSSENYFAIAYTDPESKFERSFYPDFIMKFMDGFVGIYDTKSGITAESKETTAKSDALQKYISSNKKLKLKGGIVEKSPAGWQVLTDGKWGSLKDFN